MKGDLNKSVVISASYDKKNNLWFVGLNSGLFGVVDDCKKQMRLIKYMGCQNGISEYSDVINHNGEMLFINKRISSETAVSVINQDNEIKDICLKEYPIREALIGGGRFSCVKKISNYIFMFGSAYPAVVRLDLKTKNAEYVTDWVYELRQNCEESDLGFFNCAQVELIDEYIYAPFGFVPAILKININTLQEEVIFIDAKSSGFSCIAKLEDDRFLLSGNGIDSDWLYLWNEESGKTERIIRLQDTPDITSVKYMLRDNRGGVYLFPWQNWTQVDLDIYYYDSQNQVLENTMLLEKHKNNSQLYYKCGHEIIYACWKNENVLLYITGKDLLWHEYNVETEEYIEYEMIFGCIDENNNKILKEYFKARSMNCDAISESEIDLNGFIELCL